MKNPSPFFLCTLLCLTLSFIACDDDCPDVANPECDNYDPCFGQQEVSAHFTAYDVSPSSGWLREGGWYEPYYVSDTIVRDGYFVASEEGAEYEWHIGAGVYDTREVYLDFISVDIGEVIPVTLIVRKQPDGSCFPSDDGIDTFTRQITVSKQLVNLNFLRPKQGETWVFEAQDLDNPQEVWQFTFSNETKDSLSALPTLYYDNIPKGFEKLPPYTRLLDWVFGANLFIGTYVNEFIEKTVNIGIFWVDGEYYDFKMRSWNYKTQEPEDVPIIEFRAKRIQ